MNQSDVEVKTCNRRQAREHAQRLLLHSVIGLKNSRQILNQSDAKPKQIPTRSRVFSRALRRLRKFASCFD